MHILKYYPHCIFIIVFEFIRSEKYFKLILPYIEK